MNQRSAISSRRRGIATLGLAALLCSFLLALPNRAAAQSETTSADETFHYNNLWEISGGLAFMNPRNGPIITHRADIGGGRVAATQWIYPRLGATGDVRVYAGLGNAYPNGYGVNSPLMTQTFVTVGPEWRWIRGPAIGVSFHGEAGGVYGTFNGHVPSGVTPSVVGLYPNGASAAFIGGGNIDFIRSPGFAIRITPDLVATHFGGSFQENVSLTAGFVWHFGRF